MNKKVLSLLLLMVMVLVTACGNNTSNNGSSANTGSNAAEGGETGAGDKLKVVLLIPGTLGDKSFFDSANNGLQKVKDELGAVTKVVEMGVDKTKWEPTFNDIASEDWDVIISGGSEITEMFNATAELYPDKKFINYDTDIDEAPDNMYNMSYATNEVSFLAGAVAALATQSDMPNATPENVIGFVGGMDIPGINAFLVGYIQGAQYVDPDVKVAVSYAGDFVNPAKGKELSLIQYNSGVDVIFNVAGGTGLGIFDAAKEKKKYAIGVDSDQAMLINDTDSEKANLIVTSSIKKIDTAILGAVKRLQEGTLEMGKRDVLSFVDDGVGIAENDIYKNVFPADLQAKVEEVKQKLINKEIKVDNAMGMETAEVEAIRNAVKP
ncbi:BMP family ABC transporter substrate-binding protein [Paenibacillus odorifer]|jgi:basic membrane protein A|uniref:BMP family ABC transporter substrate-binding protein n=1 Tax=Paenibacillus odorifer TaxID=189426 RepID=A0ABX3GHH2_9BACL|nr:BMP family ABC transporter substrate-binding protein [Paenibacillus odorifer]OMC68119.1 BMP family ABC transporter substrate-binding protein [Paenibacillus odorifer]OMC75908.1 BMP family ABC transporter substrate-binding protein [Paenibacillus odorifer]OMD19450.1 BMP family ABC transporter substrate-binding protein [Paenibacillus odorifer]OMD58378.1 BMP family ABC transporter substrate-binding protein [Paenibacillus odorifer]OMD86376.1 BMP family ABC transporter substrate-binding protein [P